MVWWKSHVECGGCLKVVSSPPTWMCWMSLSVWSNPSTVPMTATCRWTSVRGGRNVFGDQCRMMVVGCVTIVQLEESLSGGIFHVVVGGRGLDVVLLDGLEKQSGE